MTYNRKGGYFRTLEIVQDKQSTSVNVLSDDLITKAKNYTLRVDRFICSNTQRLNLVDEIMFEARIRGNRLEAQDYLYEPIPIGIRRFSPTVYFSTLELGR